MTAQDPKAWLTWAEEQWVETGHIPDVPPEGVLQTDDLRTQYQALLLLERAMQPSSTPVEERLQQPSTSELERGFLHVLEHVTAEQSSVKEVKPTLASVEEMTFTSVEEVEHEPSVGVATLGEPEEATSSVKEVPSSSGLGWNPSFLGWGVGAMMILVVGLWVWQPAKRPSYLQKGSGSHEGQHIQLAFGMGDAKGFQPHTRGKNGMTIAPGQWLYFLWRKDNTPGFLYLFQAKPGQSLRKLYPFSSQPFAVDNRERSWVMAHNKTALRYKVPTRYRSHGFIGVLSTKPLRRKQLARLLSWKPVRFQKKALLEQVSQRLGIVVQRVDGFVIRVREVPPLRRSNKEVTP